MSKAGLILGSIAIGLTLVSAVLRWGVSFLGIPKDGVIGVAAQLFDVQKDATIPTWFSSFLLLSAAVLVGQLIRVHQHVSHPHKADHMFRLRLLVVGFVYISVDETARIHELLNDPLGERLGLGGAFKFAWVVVAIPLVIVLAGLYLSWVRSLPPEIRNLVIVGGALFMVGAIGFEMVGGHFADSFQGAAGGFAHLEELGEMLGVVVFIEAMMHYLRILGWDGTLRLGILEESSVDGTEGSHRVALP